MIRFGYFDDKLGLLPEKIYNENLMWQPQSVEKQF